MNKKNSLTQFKKPETRILPPEPQSVPPQVTAAPQEFVMEKGRTGPKPKPASEKRSHRVMLSMTPAEAVLSRRRAGLAGEATVIMAFLKENGFFDN